MEEKEIKIIDENGTTQEEPKGIILQQKGLSNATQSKIKKILEKRSAHRENKTPLVIEKSTLNEVDLPEILGADDRDFYEAKKSLYLDAYPDIAEDPFDLDDLHMMIMEQIFQRNLFRKKKKHPNVDITDAYESSIKRHDSLKKSLAVRKQDRDKKKDSKKQTVNIANLSVQFSGQTEVDKIQERLSRLQEEEDSLRNADGKITE